MSPESQPGTAARISEAEAAALLRADPGFVATQSSWRKKTLFLSLGLVLIGALWILGVAMSWSIADAAETAPQSSARSSDDDYNFNWLDPDKKIYVLQNRKYIKARRLQLSLLAGPGISNPYRNTFDVSPRSAFYLSEDFGIEAFYTFIANTQNGTFQALENATPNAIPVVRELRSQTGLLLQWVPWYAKINVFNRILYFDWYFSGGAGVMNTALDTRTQASAQSSYQNQSFAAYYLGTGHLFHVSDAVTIRLDLTGAFYNAPLGGTTGTSSWFSNYLFGFGVGFRL